MNRKLRSVLTALCAAAMTLSLAACGEKQDAPAVTTAQTTPSAETAARSLSLKEWSLSAETWSSPNGATIHLRAIPSSYADGDSAVFVVRLEGEEIVSVPCSWEDETYVASADLNAADGYCYYVSLTAADGSTSEVAVNTPAEPVEDNYINLAAALDSYCSLTLEDAAIADGIMTIAGGLAEVQAPRITDQGENIACAQATLVLTLDGETLDSKALTMAPGDTDRSYASDLTGIQLQVPGEIGEDAQLSLRLDAELTNGQKLSAVGGTWYYLDGTLANAVG